MIPSNDYQRLRGIVVARLESLRQAGVLQLPKQPARDMLEAAASGAVAASAGATTDTSMPSPISSSSEVTDAGTVRETQVKEEREVAPKVRFGSTTGSPSVRSADPHSHEANKAPTLEVLESQVSACIRCDELARTRTQTVFGVGNPHASLCFLGEAPGADEDRTGIPFVGRAGKLLTDIIKACTLNREDVYILNMIKCRPPGNRNPLPYELNNCRHFLDRQLELINPQYICCLGAVASQNLLETQVPIGKLRGKLHDYRGIKVVCTYHPAYLLRNPGAKRDTWEDMKMLMREMGVEL